MSDDSDGALQARADVPVDQCYSRLLSDLGAASLCANKAQWKPGVSTRLACLQELRRKNQVKRKKQPKPNNNKPQKKPKHDVLQLRAVVPVAGCFSRLLSDLGALAYGKKKTSPLQTRQSARMKSLGGQKSCHANLPVTPAKRRAKTTKPAKHKKAKHGVANAPRQDDVLMFKKLTEIPIETWVLPDANDCLFCGAVRFDSEPAGFCCASGKISVMLPTMPAKLWDLYVHDMTPLGIEFRRCCRTYNNTMAFTSIRVTYDTELANSRVGVYTFRIQGMVRHYIRDLIPADGVAQALQLFFYDTQHEMKNRVAQSSHLVEEIIACLLTIVEPNPYARFFRSMIDVPDLAEYAIVLRANPSLNHNVYNLPTVDQVAAIWNEGSGPSLERPRDIRVNLHSGAPTWIHYYYACYDPLQYLLLLPMGTPGWHAGLPMNDQGANVLEDTDDNELANFIDPDMHDDPNSLLEAELENLQRNGKKKSCVPMRGFYCYWFQMRKSDKTNILKTGRLVQQFQIDIYVKIETQRLDYLRHNQSGFEMRSDTYGHLVERMTRSEFDSSLTGQRIHLSPSFTGGPRDIRRRFMNALTLVSELGRPDLFITATCNPAWIEIQSQLLQTELAQNRADLEVRVFRAKMEEMKRDIVRDSMFGKVAAYFYVIEFQKRGLPHCHWLVILKPRYKITTTEAYDRFVSAEIPDPKENPYLYRCVLTHMMHGPCGELNKKNVCMVKEKCRNFYPKDFQPKTEHRKDSYPDYMRRNNGTSATVRGKNLDNRWVIPYNPFLLAKFDCHINVQICNDIKGVKYLYKYCCKGNDQTAFNIVEGESPEPVDEISDFQKSRWLCAPEAMWRIYGFEIFEMHPTVYQLHVHLPGYQQVYYTSGQSIPTILDRTRVGKTQLTEFFALNRDNPEARAMNLLYSEVPIYFVWMQKKRYWKIRCSKVAIGRLVSVSIVEVERFYLRLLLAHVRAPKSFADVMTFKRKLHASFCEAALARGLLESDGDIRNALQEAVRYMFPMVLRRYFAMILVYISPSDPMKLWEEFKDQLSEDLLKTCKDNVVEGYKAALKCIDTCLRAMGQEIEHYSLVRFPAGLSREEVATCEYESEINVHVDEADLLVVPKLNPEQRSAYDEIMGSMDRNTECAYFVDGPGGSGKTYLYRVLLAIVRSTGGIALAVASSGVAASLLPNGRTAHSRFKIPLKLDESMSCSISKNSTDARLIIAAKLILWDEASMADRRAIEAVNLLLQDFMQNKLLFGGKTIVFGGDFRQTIPIVKRGSREDTVAACLVNSELWPAIRKIHLTHNMRAIDDPPFVEFLLRVGNGTEACVRDDTIVLPESICLPYYTTDEPLQTLIAHVFPSFAPYLSEEHGKINNAILTPKNDCVSEINDMVIDMFPGDTMEYISTDYSNDPTQQAYYQDFMNGVDVGGLAPHVLRLKKFCPVMLLRNLSPTEGLCNGTRLIITHLGERSICAVIALGDRKGQPVLIPRIPLQLDDLSKCPVVFKRHQYPIKLCFAMTINKSQGQTLDRVGVYLPQPTFLHGQLYVALSRVRSSQAIKFLMRPAVADSAATCETRNVVYKEILRKNAF